MSAGQPGCNVRDRLEKLGERRATASEHRALADEHRLAIVDELERNPQGLAASELAGRLALHPNTVRWHLARLAEVGLVTSRPEEERSRPGRPRTLFVLRADTETPGRGNYRLLAAILTGALADLPDAGERAATAGRAWGRYLVRRTPPHVAVGEAERAEAVVSLLREEGFRPEAVGREIRMHRCPFRELAQAGGGLVCAVHRGLISGALAELGSGLAVERLDAFVEPQLCVAHLAVPATAPPVDGAPDQAAGSSSASASARARATASSWE